MSFFKKRTSSSSCAPGIPPASHPGLRPLRLVEKLVAAKVISPIQPQEASPILRMLDLKKPRSSIQACKNQPAAPRASFGKPHHPSAPASAGPRLSLAGKTLAVPKKAPFVVPLHFSAPRVPRVTPRPSMHKAPIPRPAVRPVAKKTNPQSVNPLVSRISKPRVATSAHHPQVAAKATTESIVRSRIPVFVGRRSPEVLPPAPTPRYSASRIPRLKYAGSPSPSSSSETASVTSFNLQTPCPSPVLVTEALPRRVIVLDTTEVSMMTESDPSVTKVESTDGGKVAEVVLPDAFAVVDVPPPVQAATSPFTPIGVSRSLPQELTEGKVISAASDGTVPPSLPLCDTANFERVRQKKVPAVLAVVDIPPLMQAATLPFISASVSRSLPQELTEGKHISTASDWTVHSSPPCDTANAAQVHQAPANQGARTTESKGVMEALLGELKTRLAMGKKSAVTRPSSTLSPFVIINRSEGRRVAKENISAPSELQQAFARRRSGGSVISSSSYSDPKPTPQVPDRRALAPIPRVLNAPPPTEKPSPLSPSASSCPPPPSDANCNLPGADCTTELVTTVFGTRKVRRLVIPPVLEGSLPSRDPRIIMELNSLRAQQKVGKGVDGAGV
ncbi:hypothetical protein FB451DRAFT_755592 [Mycena latifolia]|nr:hypothetical protein FB451DRAFT_755592 [Mycena latifolia]